MTLQIGERIEIDINTAYDVEEAIGRGATADVYRVRARRTDHYYALKVLTDASPSLTRRLRQEFALQQGLEHPHIVRTIRLLDLPNGDPAILMELVEGPTLAELIHLRLTSIEMADRLAIQILSGAKAAHEAGLVHRDLKPGNMLLGTSKAGYIVKIADFGLAKAMDPGEDADMRHATRAGTPMGTPSYMAPEQIRNAKGVDARADVFAIGAVMYEMLCGQPPFDGDMLSVLANAEAGRYQRPSARVPNLPARMETAIAGALCARLEDRIPNVATLEALWKGLAPPRPYLLPPDALFGKDPANLTPAPARGATGPNGIEFVERMSAAPRRSSLQRVTQPEPPLPPMRAQPSLQPVSTLPERTSQGRVEQQDPRGFEPGQGEPRQRMSLRPVDDYYPPPPPAGVPFVTVIVSMLAALLIGAAIVAGVIFGLGDRNQITNTVSLPSPVTSAEAAQPNPVSTTPQAVPTELTLDVPVAVPPPEQATGTPEPKVTGQPKAANPPKAVAQPTVGTTRPPVVVASTPIPPVVTTTAQPVTTAPVVAVVATQKPPIAKAVSHAVMLEDLDVAVRGDVVVLTGTLSNANVQPIAFDQQGANATYPNQYVIQYKGGGSGLGTRKVQVGVALVSDVTIEEVGGKLVITVNSKYDGRLNMVFQSGGSRFTVTVTKP